MHLFDSLESIRIGSMSLSSLLSALILLAVCAVIISVINRLLKKVLAKSNLEKSMLSFIRSSVKIGLWFVAIIITAGSLGIPVTSLVALLSVAGVALSLSIQGVLSNVFAGISVLTVRPFTAGDYVEIGGVQGTVREVRLITTAITTADNRIIYIPNSEVASTKLINYSHEERRRVDLSFNVSYDCPTETVKCALLDAMFEDADILVEPPPFAALKSYGDSSIEYILRAWTNNESYWDVYFRLNEAVREKFAAHGVKMSYPHINVHMVERTKDEI